MLAKCVLSCILSVKYLVKPRAALSYVEGARQVGDQACAWLLSVAAAFVSRGSGAGSIGEPGISFSWSLEFDLPGVMLAQL